MMNKTFLFLFMILISTQTMESPYYYDDNFRFLFKHDDPGGNLIIIAYFKDDPWYGGRKRYGEKWEPFKGHNYVSINASILIWEINGWMEHEDVGETPLIVHLPSGTTTIRAEYEGQWINKDVEIFPNVTTTIEVIFNKNNPIKQWYYSLDRIWVEYKPVVYSIGLMFAFILGLAGWERFNKKPLSQLSNQSD